MQDLSKENLAILARLLDLLKGGEALTREDFLKQFEGIVNYVKKIEAKNELELKAISEIIQKLGERLKAETSANTASMAKTVRDTLSAQIASLEANFRAKMALVDEKVAELKDGESIVGPAGADGKDGSPDSPEEVRDKLETLEGDERLDVRAIKGIEGLNVVQKGVTVFGGSGGIQLYVDGVKKGTIKTLNIVPGTGVAITHVNSYGRNDITISASGSALSKLTATGTVNGVNADFTFASKPTIIIVDGASYQENKGWTWNAGTLTATMTIPPTSDIYAL